MKILLVITGLGMGGAEHVVVNLADRLAALGHEVKIAYLTGPALVTPVSPDIELVPIGMTSTRSFFTGYLKLRNLVKNYKPDVVHSHMVHANILSRLLRATLKIPRLVCTAHNTDEGGRFRMLAYRLTDRFADISTNVSREAVESFVRKGAVRPERMVAVPNGIDPDKFFFDKNVRNENRKNLFTEKNIILAVGRFNEAKDYPNLLNAISILRNKRDDFKLIIVGDGPLKSELTTYVEHLRLDSFVCFLGIRTDIPDLMSSSDIFVLSSAWEGFGLVVSEAMACERLVVATDCGGVREVVGSCGILLEPKNSDLLAQALNKALDMSPQERATIGVSARQRIIDKYSLDSNVESFMKLYIG
ncbi:MAG: glycosyltransferase [Desulfobulbus sp.]